MSSIIAKPLRRRSHQWHSSLAAARWLIEPLRPNVSDYRRLREPDRGRRAQRYQCFYQGLHHATRGHHSAVEVKGPPAKPQYPLRGSDGGGSLVSHRHIMQPDAWHRKKFRLIW
jgi:hypothetical protein